MARWNEEQGRWTGRGDRYRDEERRFREDRGEEGWRARDWRDEDRPGEGWRAVERGEWGERGGGWGERRDWGERPGSPEWSRGRPYHHGGGGMYGGARGEHRGRNTGYGYGPVERWREGRGDWGGESFRAAEHEPGAFERMGERIREGVRKLTGRGPKNYRRSDERIHEDVCERIARSWVDASEVEVKVDGGEVTLTGLVDSREDKRLLEDLAEEVFGVEDVHNELRVNRGARRPAPEAEGTSIPAGTGTTGTGVAMSAQQAGSRSPSQSRPPPPERH